MYGMCLLSTFFLVCVWWLVFFVFVFLFFENCLSNQEALPIFPFDFNLSLWVLSLLLFFYSILFYYVILYYIILYYILLYFIMLYYIILLYFVRFTDIITSLLSSQYSHNYLISIFLIDFQLSKHRRFSVIFVIVSHICACFFIFIIIIFCSKIF